MGSVNIEPEPPPLGSSAPSLWPVAASLLAIAACVAVDILSALGEGATWGHVASGAAVISLAGLGLTRVASLVRADTARLSGEVGRLQSESAAWQANATR